MSIGVGTHSCRAPARPAVSRARATSGRTQPASGTPGRGGAPPWVVGAMPEATSAEESCREACEDRLGRAARGTSRRVGRAIRACGSHHMEAKVYGVDMAFTLWLSAEEERILAKIMRAEGTRTKEQAVIKAIRDKGELLAVDRPTRETPGRAERAPGA